MVELDNSVSCTRGEAKAVWDINNKFGLIALPDYTHTIKIEISHLKGRTCFELNQFDNASTYAPYSAENKPRENELRNISRMMASRKPQLSNPPSSAFASTVLGFMKIVRDPRTGASVDVVYLPNSSTGVVKPEPMTPGVAVPHFRPWMEQPQQLPRPQPHQYHIKPRVNMGMAATTATSTTNPPVYPYPIYQGYGQIAVGNQPSTSNAQIAPMGAQVVPPSCYPEETDSDLPPPPPNTPEMQVEEEDRPERPKIKSILKRQKNDSESDLWTIESRTGGKKIKVLPPLFDNTKSD